MDLPARMEMPARTKNGSEHCRCDRLDAPKYKTNTAILNKILVRAGNTGSIIYYVVEVFHYQLIDD